MKHRAVKRRTVVVGLGSVAGAAAVGGFAANAQAESRSSSRNAGKPGNSGALIFDPSAYTELTTTITTDAGDKEVTYHFWKAITYVSAPVDAEHQSLVVSVPVRIDGKAVDATNAPILFSNSVGGYFPASVATAAGVGEAAMEMGDLGGMGGGTGAPPAGTGTGAGTVTPTTGTGTAEAPSGSNDMLNGMGQMVSLPKLGLAAGYVVVEPGCRGRTLTDASGTYYGTAPAAIVDLKAAVRYVRSNQGRVPGDTRRIVSTGTSAGGALSALLGASGDSSLYTPYLEELGAAEASDAVFASGDWCPITDLEHADGAYEWNWGANTPQSGTLDQSASKELRAQFAEYQASLRLKGLNGFGPLTARNYDEYLLETYVRPAATTHLKGLAEADRSAYLSANPFITWKNGRAAFTWADYLAHVGARKKTAPAFDTFDLSGGENNEFGTGTTEARHFTAYGQRHDTTGLTAGRVDSDIPALLDLMNPMYHLARHNPGRSKHWWIRVGTKDTDTALTVVGNLAATLHGLGDDVNSLMYWDQGHGSNTDAADFIAWVARVTGHRK
ncbi:subtype B tannase [Streptomyces sp. NBC_00102]|uniref:subtype B tannase n=1 Tax=Streptomyces sp. NBC_00102 TaxID=2975652 RepID=UPI00224E37ED|nr:subtype B tannase [Streptomyces sp. NBC_00102]MCX5397744.1 Tat pathway signal sequence domain protein [Streptomyces sp. NBC_00102]